jgi:hypothetical protein
VREAIDLPDNADLFGPYPVGYPVFSWLPTNRTELHRTGDGLKAGPVMALVDFSEPSRPSVPIIDHQKHFRAISLNLLAHATAIWKSYPAAYPVSRSLGIVIALCAA